MIHKILVDINQTFPFSPGYLSVFGAKVHQKKETARDIPGSLGINSKVRDRPLLCCAASPAAVIAFFLLPQIAGKDQPPNSCMGLSILLFTRAAFAFAAVQLLIHPR